MQRAGTAHAKGPRRRIRRAAAVLVRRQKDRLSLSLRHPRRLADDAASDLMPDAAAVVFEGCFLGAAAFAAAHVDATAREPAAPFVAHLALAGAFERVAGHFTEPRVLKRSAEELVKCVSEERQCCEL